MTGHRLEAIADSSVSRILSRWGTPILLTVIGFLLVRGLDRMESTQAAQGKEQIEMKGALLVLTTRLDAQVIKQLDDTTTRVSDHERRIQGLERSVRTP